LVGKPVKEKKNKKKFENWEKPMKIIQIAVGRGRVVDAESVVG
jgi:hypothetical protein